MIEFTGWMLRSYEWVGVYFVLPFLFSFCVTTVYMEWKKRRKS